MSFLETLATRFVENDFLPAEEQDKIIAEAAECMYVSLLSNPKGQMLIYFLLHVDVKSGYQQQQRASGSPAIQLAQSIQTWVSFSNNQADNESGASIEKTAKGKKPDCFSMMLN